MDLSKKAHTLIGSCIFVTIFVIYPNITQSQVVNAVVDPLVVSNNKFGIHIISPVPEEASNAASLVNSSGGDWGYVTFLIQSNDRNENKWQEFFNELRRRHLIPIVRLSTKPLNAHWERPTEEDAKKWAEFLNSLNWPVKNRYVIVYNEPNHGQEWEQEADPQSYAKVLNETIDALKNTSPDFFVLNAGFDQATPHQPPHYFDEVRFLEEMAKSVPGIFNKLDGWSSHSYPNPAFAGSPDAAGRGTIRGFLWEMQVLSRLGVNKNLPVFVTETGWKHAEGIKFDPSLPTSALVGQFFQNAFGGAWSNNRIVAVTPFLLNYQEPPFDHFSFKKYSSADFYPQFEAVSNLIKTSGKPAQINTAVLEKGEVYHTIVAGQEYNIRLTFKNTGQSIWDPQTKLVALQGGTELGIGDVAVEGLVEPQEKYTFLVKLKAPEQGTYKVVLNLMSEGKLFDSPSLEFTTEVKSPVLLVVKSGRHLKRDHAGDYYLETKGVSGESIHLVKLGREGTSKELEAQFLLPDYTFEFTFKKPFYKSKTIKVPLKSGTNELDFGKLEPDFLRTLLSPKELWNLLPLW